MKKEKNAGDSMKGLPPTTPAALRWLTELGQIALAAKAADDRQGAAFEDELRAEIVLLEKVIEQARPGFPSIMNAVEGFPMKAAQLLVGTVPDVDRLWILEDGGFAQQSPLEAGRLDTVRTLTLADVLDGWSLPAIVSALATLFQKQITGRTAPAIEAEARAAKLTAIAKLLEE